MCTEQVEDIMNKLMAQMGNLEEKIGQEQARQRRVIMVFYIIFGLTFSLIDESALRCMPGVNTCFQDAM